MKLAVSNIAWTPNEEPEVAKVLQQLGVKFVEIAPTKVWDDPLRVTDRQIQEYLDFWANYGITVVAFQSMLFPRPDLKIFESAETRRETAGYLKGFIILAGKMKAGVLVFGSPKNRQLGEMSKESAYQIGSEFFDSLGDESQQNNTLFCIEPNAPQYNCDFVTNADEGIEFVDRVDNAGFGLHLDIACMTMAGDDVTASIERAGQRIQHFHISSPMLEVVEERNDVPHEAAAEALNSIGYDNFVSIEMRPGEEGTNVDRVRTAVALAQKYYA